MIKTTLVPVLCSAAAACVAAPIGYLAAPRPVPRVAAAAPGRAGGATTPRGASGPRRIASRAASPMAPGGACPAAAPTPQRPSTRTGIQSPEEAADLFEASLARGDLAGLVRVAADLLRFGEAGYAELDALILHLTEPGAVEALRTLWADEGMVFGEVLPAAFNDPEGVLRYALHVRQRDPESLHPILARVGDEFFRGPAAALLGAYTGGDPSLHAAFVDYYRSQMSTGPIDGHSVAALGRIPTAESTALLTDLWRDAGPHEQLQIVRALAVQGTPEAVRAIEWIAAQTQDDRARAAADAALAMVR